MPSQKRQKNFMPTLVDGPDFSLLEISTTTVQEADISVTTFSETFNHAQPIGISPGYSLTGEMIALAIADYDHCIIVEFNHTPPRHNGGGRNRPAARNLDDLQTQILCRSAGELFAFDMAPLALSLYLDANLRVTNAVDIQSGNMTEKDKKLSDRKPLTAIKQILGSSDSVSIISRNVIDAFDNMIYKPGDYQSASNLTQRAWVSQLLVVHGNGAESMTDIRRINTQKFSEQKLDMIAKVANDMLRQDVKKPLTIKHQAKIVSTESGTGVVSEIFKNKIRTGRELRIVAQGPAGEYVVPAQSGKMSGKSGNLAAERSLRDTEITLITSIGRDEPTTAESKRAAIILRFLQEEQILNESPWVRNIWFVDNDSNVPLPWPATWSNSLDELIEREPPSVLLRLNHSQQDAVNTMYSTLDEHRITIIQGPPGTGKTSVIASFVVFAIQTGSKGIWLIAQSNVAVKNIAEKLASVGFMDFRLLVSQDFIFQWHEHIYMKIPDRNIIRSDDFTKINPLYALRGCQVILSTLSMLSNALITKFTTYIPIKTLVVDEASQIEIGGYLPVLSDCKTLRKLCFIGDDRQLPPYGQEELGNLQSIFEVAHLRSHAIFLNTQYRMPPQIGDIISRLVYDGKLSSNPLHPITDKTAACRFIDVPSQEERSGDSFKNTAECTVVVQLARQLQEKKINYQIISPYDGQRTTIEKEMALQDLDWKNKCFNVDSFQGNEEDYIIISLVRSREIGFLANRRRTNVMLTRCKKGMFIVSSQKFLNDKHGGAATLVGELLEQVGEEAWLDLKDFQEGRF